MPRFVSGPADSKWGSQRAEQGHPEPWALNYFAIGNEVGLWLHCMTTRSSCAGGMHRSARYGLADGAGFVLVRKRQAFKACSC